MRLWRLPGPSGGDGTMSDLLGYLLYLAVVLELCIRLAPDCGADLQMADDE